MKWRSSILAGCVTLWPFAADAQDFPGIAPYGQVLPSPLIRDLQLNLRRLAYYQGDADGLRNPDLLRALLAFEHDEQVAPEAEPTPATLQLSNEAIARIRSGGSCEDPGPLPAGTSMACGSIR